MINSLKLPLSMSPATGDHPSEQTIIRTVNFERYAVELKLAEDGKFLGISSIKVRKSFMESGGYNQISDVHNVDEYYNEE